VRTVELELLDELPTDDARAIHARRDLQKVNALMGHARIMSCALRETLRDTPSPLIVELGSGDGTLLLQVARRLGARATPLRAVLVDRRPSLSSQGRAAFNELGWHVETMAADVFEWLNRPHPDTADVTIANLFLHHFAEGELATLLRSSSRQTRNFVACEPFRSRTSLIGATLLRFIGCNSVTRHDARISVKAGFRNQELSALWPKVSGWRLTEGRAGRFTHTFVAQHEQAV
jgi:SAM-dependent methyltransferase